MILSKYSEIMEHIYVTPDMKDRILSGISRHFRIKYETGRRRSRIYSLGAVAAAAVIICSVGLWQHSKPAGTDTGDTYESQPVAGAFAVIDCASVQELSGIVGFDVPVLSSLPFEVQQTTYTALGNELAQVRYFGADESDVLTYRKSPGEEDNSGDYTQYSETDVLEADGLQINVKGNDGLIYLSCWNDGGYAYSISSGAGLTRDEVIGLVFKRP